MNKLWAGVLSTVAKRPNSINVIASILAALSGVLLGFMIMILVNPSEAAEGIRTMVFGPLEDMRNIGRVLRVMVPIMLTGLSVAFAFRTGLFNIGASGQMMIGGVLAIYVGVHWTFLGSFQWVVATFAAIIGGALWGAIPGILKAYRNVHEVVASIMLNYVALYTARLFIENTMYDEGRQGSMRVTDSGAMPGWFLPDLFDGAAVSVGLIIGLFVVVIIHVILNHTTFGYELKSVGFSRPAAKYAGIKERRSVVLSMVIAGALAGLAGAVYFLDTGRRFAMGASIYEQGFTGIAIALLALSAPIGVVIVAFFYASIYHGGWLIQIKFREEIIDIIIGFIIYFSALSLFTKQFIANYIRRRTKKSLELQDKVGDV